MARPIREDYPGAWHHVMNRGRNRDNIFMNDDDAVDFLDAVGDTVERFDIEVHGFSIMPNHVHLVVRAGRDPLTRLMKPVHAGFGGWLSKRIGKGGGPVFAGRYKSVLVEEEAYPLGNA